MRYIIALLLIAVASPCYALNTTYIVQPYHPNANNVTVANGGGTADTPWISVSYGVAQISGNNDTFLIYPGNPGSDSYYYNEYVDFSGETISFIGVSVGGDSPTFSRRAPASNTAWFFFLNNTAAYRNQVISGLRFTNSNAQYNGIALFANKLDGTVVRDCIFDSVTFTGTYGIGMGCIAFVAYSANDTVSVYNNSFLNLKSVAPLKLQAQNASTVLNAAFYNNSVRSAPWVMNNSVGANNQVMNVLLKDNIIDSVGYMSYNYWSAGTSCVSNYNYIFNDTYSVVFSGYSNDANLTINNTFSNNYNVQPQWKYALTDALARYNYLVDTAVTPFIDGSSSSGLIGVLWGWAAATPTPTATLNYLYRGMNLLQRFEIIRRH